MKTLYPILVSVAAVLLLCGCPSDPEPAAPAEPGPWAFDHSSDHWWMSVYVRSATDRWIVGGQPKKGRVMHDTGAGFELVDTGQDTGLLNWVHGFDDGGLVVVGNGGVALRADSAGADSAGTEWSAVATPTDQTLWGVWGSSPQDVWAVGGNATGDTVATVLRDTGSGFEAVTIPPLVKTGVDAIFKVWGSSADNVFMVGQQGVVLRYNGSELVEEDVPGITEDLISVWGTGPDRVAVVGGRSNGVVGLWDGGSWRSVKLFDLAIGGLNGVWIRDDVVHGVGIFGTVVRLSFASGDVLDDDILDTGTVDLHAINGGADGTMTAVGGNFVRLAGPWEGHVVSRPLVSGE